MSVIDYAAPVRRDDADARAHVREHAGQTGEGREERVLLQPVEGAGRPSRHGHHGRRVEAQGRVLAEARAVVDDARLFADRVRPRVQLPALEVAVAVLEEIQRRCRHAVRDQGRARAHDVVLEDHHHLPEGPLGQLGEEGVRRHGARQQPLAELVLQHRVQVLEDLPLVDGGPRLVEVPQGAPNLAPDAGVQPVVRDPQVDALHLFKIFRVLGVLL
mmetsp:Transcript_27804/g.83343  ORF Transcript_27804/g.83343 Transcript_27804/m.83343 type:complete len:216 (-) Transcript_27804:800-1447(-)